MTILWFHDYTAKAAEKIMPEDSCFQAIVPRAVGRVELLQGHVSGMKRCDQMLAKKHIGKEIFPEQNTCFTFIHPFEVLVSLQFGFFKATF